MKSEEEIIKDALDEFEKNALAHGVSLEDIVSALELKLNALRERIKRAERGWWRSP